MDWYREQTQWGEGHSYDDPLVTSVELNNWFMEMIKTFPAMNGPFAQEIDDDDESPMITGYTVGRDCIYLDFRWSVAEHAYENVFELARKHGIGFFDVSSDYGDIFFPENGDLIPIERNVTKTAKTSEYQIDVMEKTDNGIIKHTMVRQMKPWWKFW